jgi:hypothetical protein
MQNMMYTFAEFQCSVLVVGWQAIAPNERLAVIALLSRFLAEKQRSKLLRVIQLLRKILV